ncbi:MAG TPA: hypothetical protein VFG68_20370 [Fimbriiglobus sp.]|nr:hypothetical protein [Fimbriiglobus sp.]
MRTPRLLSLRSAAAVALAGLLVATGWTAAKRPHTMRGGTNDVKISTQLNDYDTVFVPYPLNVDYTTGQSSLQVDIYYSGKDVPAQAAPPGGPALTFTLDVDADITCDDVTAKLETASSPHMMKASDMRYCITFIKDGQLPFQYGKLPEGVKLATKSAKSGGPIPVGLHHSHFPPYPAILPGAHARIWVQGRPTAGGPLKPVYDLPAVLSWQQRDGKWYPRWVFVAAHQLDAGKGFLTVMRPVLLDHDGKVLRIMTHPH